MPPFNSLHLEDYQPTETFIFIARSTAVDSPVNDQFILPRSTANAPRRYVTQYGITAGSLTRELHIIQYPDTQLKEMYFDKLMDFISESSATNGQVCLVVVGWNGFTTHKQSFELLFEMIGPPKCIRPLIFWEGQFYPIYVGTVLDYPSGMPMALSQGDPTTKFAAQFIHVSET